MPELPVNEALMNTAQDCSAHQFRNHNPYEWQSMKDHGRHTGAASTWPASCSGRGKVSPRRRPATGSTLPGTIRPCSAMPPPASGPASTETAAWSTATWWWAIQAESAPYNSKPRSESPSAVAEGLFSWAKNEGEIFSRKFCYWLVRSRFFREGSEGEVCTEKNFWLSKSKKVSNRK